MFSAPNKLQAAYLRQAGLYGADLVTLAGGLAGDGALIGLGVSEQGSPDMTVAVAAGLVRIQGYFAYVAAQNVNIAAADASFDRIDLITVDWNGTVSRTAGTAGTATVKPSAPDVPANSIVLAQVYVQAAAANIPNANIYDRRAVVPDYFDIADEFLTSGLTTTGNIGALGWGASASGTAGSAYQAGVASHPGIYRLQSGGTSGNNARMHFRAAANDVSMVPADIARMRALVQIPTITSIAVKIGLGVDLSDSAAGSLGSAGAFFEFVVATSAKWRMVTRQASTSTTNADTGADVAANTWYLLDVLRKQNGDWQFAINNVLKFTHNANQPSTGVNVGFLAHTLTGAARSIDIDFFGLNFKPLGNRFT